MVAMYYVELGFNNCHCMKVLIMLQYNSHCMTMFDIHFMYIIIFLNVMLLHCYMKFEEQEMRIIGKL